MARKEPDSEPLCAGVGGLTSEFTGTASVSDLEEPADLSCVDGAAGSNMLGISRAQLVTSKRGQGRSGTGGRRGAATRSDDEDDDNDDDDEPDDADEKKQRRAHTATKRRASAGKEPSNKASNAGTTKKRKH